MPSESKMAVRFDTTRTEVRKAYLHLEEKGYIHSLQGYGSFFSGKKEKIRLLLNDSQSFLEKMNSIGIHYRTENVGFELIKDNLIVSEMFQLSEKEMDFHDIYKLTLLRFVDDEPVAIRVSYLPDYAFPDLAQRGLSITSLAITCTSVVTMISPTKIMNFLSLLLIKRSAPSLISKALLPALS